MIAVGQARTSPESMLQVIFQRLAVSQPQLLLQAGWMDYSPLRDIYLQVAESRRIGGNDGSQRPVSGDENEVSASGGSRHAEDLHDGRLPGMDGR